MSVSCRPHVSSSSTRIGRRLLVTSCRHEGRPQRWLQQAWSCQGAGPTASPIAGMAFLYADLERNDASQSGRPCMHFQACTSRRRQPKCLPGMLHAHDLPKVLCRSIDQSMHCLLCNPSDLKSCTSGWNQVSEPGASWHAEQCLVEVGSCQGHQHCIVLGHVQSMLMALLQILSSQARAAKDRAQYSLNCIERPGVNHLHLIICSDAAYVSWHVTQARLSCAHTCVP